MKTATVIVSLVSLTLLAGLIIHLNREAPPPPSPPSAEPASKGKIAPATRLAFPNEEAPSTPPPVVTEGAAQVSVEIPPASDAVSEGAADPSPQPTPLSRAIDTLVSPQASFQQRYEAWRQLQDAAQLDQAIEALKQGAADHPTSAAYPAALGQAQLYKAGELARKGGTINEMGILGMQADQNFDAALNLDPANWEAQFFKAAAMSHWPLELNKGEEVVQRLSKLIDQQDTMSPQPQFAQTYVVLGDQYQKMGKPDYAAATWLIGAQRYPGNPELQQKIRGN